MRQWVTLSLSAGIFLINSQLAPVARAQEAQAPPALEDHYADINGVRIHYKSAGKGKLILFLHGFPEFWYEWKNQLAEFGRDYRATVPDMRGHNLSSKPAEVDQYKLKTLVEECSGAGRKFRGKEVRTRGS